MHPHNDKQVILVTGATGFIGQHLVRELLQHPTEYHTCVAVRASTPLMFNQPCEPRLIADISPETDWSSALKHCDILVHLAGCVHRSQPIALEEYRRVNVDGTLNLARQAVSAGVKRFIFISSIKVHGEETALGCVYSAQDAPHPHDFYAQSKHEAEEALRALSAKTGLELVIIRPPLVYGEGVRGNLERLMKLLMKGYPLPFKNTQNKRSLVSVHNLVDLIVCCLDHPQAANQVFLVSDGYDLSTTELVQHMAVALNKTPWLIDIPRWALKGMATVFGKRADIQRLFGSLQVDIKKTCELLDWKPSSHMKPFISQLVNAVKEQNNAAI